MKAKNKIKRLKARIDNWENNPTIRSANQKSAGSFKKPGSLNK
jgi:hypothetical protein